MTHLDLSVLDPELRRLLTRSAVEAVELRPARPTHLAPAHHRACDAIDLSGARATFLVRSPGRLVEPCCAARAARELTLCKSLDDLEKDLAILLDGRAPSAATRTRLKDLLEHPALAPLLPLHEQVDQLLDLCDVRFAAWADSSGAGDALDLYASLVAAGLSESDHVTSLMRTSSTARRPLTLDEARQVPELEQVWIDGAHVRAFELLLSAHAERDRPQGTVLVHFPHLPRLFHGGHLPAALEHRHGTGVRGVFLLPRSLAPLMDDLPSRRARATSALLTGLETPELLETAILLLGDGGRTAEQALIEARALL